MKLKTLMNADVLQENPKNKVELEHITGIVLNAECFVEHSIYFADSLKVFSDVDMTNYLTEGTDYEFAEMDSIASEQSNQECYRAIVFFTDISEAFISYHSYGDIVSAETLNDIVNEVNTGIDNNLSLETELTDLKNNFDIHIKSTNEHGANDTAEPATIALRTKKGTVKVASPIEANDAVTKNFQEVKIQESETKTVKLIEETRKEIITDIEKLENKVKAENSVLELADFYPNEMVQEEVDKLPTNEQQVIIAQAESDLNTRVNETNPFYNVVRNENGSVTVPDAVNENDAVNKKALDVVTQKAGNNTIAIENLIEVVSQIDTSSNYIDHFVFDSTKEIGTRIETNKMWDGKKVYRVGVKFQGVVGNKTDWTPISNNYTIINACGVSVSSSGFSKGISFSDIILTKGNTYPLYYFYVYSERYTTCYLSFEYVE